MYRRMFCAFLSFLWLVPALSASAFNPTIPSEPHTVVLPRAHMGKGQYDVYATFPVYEGDLATNDEVIAIQFPPELKIPNASEEERHRYVSTELSSLLDKRANASKMLKE